MQGDAYAGEYRTPNNVIIADSKSDIWSTNFEDDVDVDEHGSTIPLTENVWSGTSQHAAVFSSSSLCSFSRSFYFSGLSILSAYFM